MKFFYAIFFVLLLSSFSVYAQDDTLGEDFAQELSGYGDLLGRVPDTMVNAVVYAGPYAVFVRSFAVFLFGSLFLLFLAVSVFRGIGDKGRALGKFAIITTFAFLLLKPTGDDFIIRSENGDQFARLPGHSVGAAYPLKGAISILFVLNSGLENFLRSNNFTHVASEQVYNFVNRNHLNDFKENKLGEDKYILKPLKEFYDRCTPIAHSAAADNEVNVSTNDFIALGLLGGNTIGEGFMFTRPPQEGDQYTLSDLNSSDLNSSRNPGGLSGVFNGVIHNSRGQRWFDSRSRAAHFLYENGRAKDAGSKEVEINVRSYSAWLDLMPNSIDVERSNEIIPAGSSPFSSDVTRPVFENPSIYANGNNNPSLEVNNNKNGNGQVFYVDSCWSAYVAAETALTYYYDAVHDSDASRLEACRYCVFDTFTPRQQSRSEGTPFSTRSAYTPVSTFTVWDAQNQIASYVATGERGNNNIGDSAKNIIHTAITAFKEVTQPYTVIGIASILIMGMVTIYVLAPLLFVFSLIIPDLLVLTFKIIFFLLISTIVAILLYNLGATILYQVMWSFYQNNLGNFGAPDINTSLLYVSIYMALLIVLPGSIFVIGYFIVWKDAAGLKRLSGESAGLTGAVGGVILTIGSLAAGRFMGSQAGRSSQVNNSQTTTGESSKPQNTSFGSPTTNLNQSSSSNSASINSIPKVTSTSSSSSSPGKKEFDPFDFEKS